MYGMVNRAIDDLVVEHHGDVVWERIRTRAGIDVEVFISNEPYPDQMTFALVEATATELNTPAPEILEAFGRYWVLKTAQRSYGDMMAAGGRSLPEFLVALPTFHTRVSLVFPNLAPPEFECTDITENSLRLHYRSTRAGLAHFVIGLVHGLAARFHTTAVIEHLEHKANGADHDEFLVRW